jgi:hypothetical protein
VDPGAGEVYRNSSNIQQEVRSPLYCFSFAGEFICPDLIETARREWNQQLSPFLAKAPQKERILDEVQALILALF